MRSFRGGTSNRQLEIQSRVQWIWDGAVYTDVTNMKRSDEVTKEPCRIPGELRMINI